MPTTYGTVTPVEIVMGGKGFSRPFLLLAGTKYVAGTVMGIVTASGKAKSYSALSTDGSQIPVGILADNIDLTATGPKGSVDDTASIYVGPGVIFYYSKLTGMDTFAQRYLGRYLSTIDAFVLGHATSSHVKKIASSVNDVAYQAVPTDEYIAVTALTAGRTITLPAIAAMAAGAVLVIKDESGAATTYDITIDGNASETIDGAGTLVIDANYGSARLIARGTAWFTW